MATFKMVKGPSGSTGGIPPASLPSMRQAPQPAPNAGSTRGTSRGGKPKANGFSQLASKRGRGNRY